MNILYIFLISILLSLISTFIVAADSNSNSIYTPQFIQRQDNKHSIDISYCQS
jgi:hypothetical protein